jgi:hypothetical protein
MKNKNEKLRFELLKEKLRGYDKAERLYTEYSVMRFCEMLKTKVLPRMIKERHLGKSQTGKGE